MRRLIVQGFIISKSSAAWRSEVHTGTVVLNNVYIPRLPVLKVQSDAGIFEIQQIDTGNIKLYYSRGNTVKQITATVCGKEACVVIHIVLSGRIMHTTKQAGEKALHTGQYCICFVPVQETGISIKGAQRLTVLDIQLPANMVVALLAIYPAYGTFSEKIKHNEACYLSDDVLYMHAGLYDIVTRLLFAPYSNTLHALYEDLCYKLLREMLTTIMHNGDQNNRPEETWIQAVYGIKSVIDEHINRHYSIAILCKKAGINARQLKTGFKALFGTGVYAYLKAKRLEAAYEALMQQQQPLKHIARQCGYKSTGGFIKAFKKHFGKTPGMVRRK